MLREALTRLLVLDILTTTFAATVCPGEMRYDVSRKECVCPRDMFYDQAVKICTDCFQLCHNAEIQRTEDECETLCPEYQLPAMEMPVVETLDTKAIKCGGDMYFDETFENCTCEKDKYYDEVARLCTECHVICWNAEIQMTTDDCKTHCPYYHLPFSTTLSPPASVSDLHKVVIITVVSASIVICLILAVAAYCCRKQIKRKVQTLCSMMGNILPCVTENRTGDEVDHDKLNKKVQLAIAGRPKEAWDMTQPHDKEEAGPIIPSGNTVELSDQETEVKEALLPGAEV